MRMDEIVNDICTDIIISYYYLSQLLILIIMIMTECNFKHQLEMKNHWTTKDTTSWYRSDLSK